MLNVVNNIYNTFRFDYFKLPKYGPIHCVQILMARLDKLCFLFRVQSVALRLDENTGRSNVPPKRLPLQR